MRESRVLKVQNRIIILADVRKLATVLWNEFKRKRSSNQIRINFSASCEDGSSFSSGGISIFADDSIIALKRVNSVSMSYWNYKEGARIEIGLNHGNNSYGNSISVDGDDSKWVNGTLRILEEIISSFTPQKPIATRYRFFLNSAFALGIGSIYVWFIIFVSSSKSSSPPDWLLRYPFLTYVIKYSLAYLAGYLPGMLLTDKVKGLWPSIEFQIGPEHVLVEKKRRLWLLNILVIGVLPLLLSLIYDIGKAIMSGD
ncbi:MAG: hypothetical protein ACOYZ8_03660 [Chloroflexota bacterium]